MKRFIPEIFAESFYDIDWKSLKDKEILGLILDVDNTLSDYVTLQPSEKLVNYIETLKKDFKIVILSNNSGGRVKKFAKELGVTAIYRARKPRKSGFLRSAKEMNIPMNKIAVIGDQLFTDVLGANRVGAVSVLVRPMGMDTLPFIKLKRVVERHIMTEYFKSKGYTSNKWI